MQRDVIEHEDMRSAIERAEVQMKSQFAELELVRGELQDEVHCRTHAEEDVAAAEAHAQDAEHRAKAAEDRALAVDKRVQRRDAHILELEGRLGDQVKVQIQMTTEREWLMHDVKP